MADEIKISCGLFVNNGSVKVGPTNKTFSYDQAVARAGNPGVVAVGTAEETISFGDLTPGWCELTNLDATNYVEFGFSTGVLGIVLPAGARCVLKLNGIALIAKANTASCDVQILGVSD